MANICRSLQKKFFFSPVLKSSTHIGFIGVKKNGSKISHLGTFKKELNKNKYKNVCFPYPTIHTLISSENEHKLTKVSPPAGYYSI
jgi:hypothetical protein